MHVTFAVAVLSYYLLTWLPKVVPGFSLDQGLTLIISVITGVAFYLSRKFYLNVVVGTCSCYCGPGKCECTCGCREHCECFYRNKEDYYSNIRRRGADNF